MLPKAVPSIVGRFVGIAAVLLSPLVAGAAEPSDAPSSGAEVAVHAADAPSKASTPRHAHNRKGDKRDKRDKRDASEKKVHKRGSRHDDAKVTTERASAKNPPKQSTMPLATLAAAATKPLVEPISNKATIAIEPKAHAAEPRRTPIIRASAHVRDADTEADAAPPKRKEKHAKSPCLHAPVSVTRGTEEQTFPLTKCDGSVAPNAIEEMSILVRPGSAAKPASGLSERSAKKGESGKDDELAPGIKKIDPRLVERLQLVVDHFSKQETTPKVFVVSGYRPTSKGSFHALGRAIDFRMDGVEETDLVAFCKTLPDTGCGFYPNSSFIHLDVRDSGTGHVSWIDASSPGEKPDYVAAWPPPPPNDEEAVKLLAKLDELQILPPSREKGADKGKATDAEDAKPEPQVKETSVSLTRKLDTDDGDR